jgi:voltage-gated potassium channel
VAATPSDPDNVFIALSARELHPGIAVHARAETEAGLRRLRLAGANQAIGIHHLGGQRIAQAIVRPAVVDFLELSSPGVGADIDLEEVKLSEDCALDGVRLRDLPGRGVTISVVAIKRAGSATQLDPGADDLLRGGDHVVVVGDRDNVRRLAQLAEAAGPTGPPR